MERYTRPLSAGIVSVNGQISDLSEAKISASDRGFLFADSVFETLVAFEYLVLEPLAHFSRLRASADAKLIPIPWADEDLLFEVKTLIEQLGAAKTQIRLVVTGGEGFGLAPATKVQPSKMIYALPATHFPESVYLEGLALKTVQRTRSHSGVKHSDYSEAIVAIKKVKKADFDEILWLNQNSEFIEAATANIFFISREGDSVEIATPPLTQGALAGTVRSRIIRLLEAAKIRVTERPLELSELARFDEAFLTSSVRGLVPVKKIDSHKLSSARDKSVFRKIESLHLTWLESLLGKRVEWNTGKPSAF